MVSTGFDTEQLVAQWIEYWNNHDAKGAYDFFDDQFEFYSPFLSNSKKFPDGKIKSKDALKNYFEKIITNIPDLQLQIKDIKTSDNVVQLDYYSKTENLVASGTIEFNEKGKIKKSYFDFKEDKTFARRTSNIPKSFIREILKVTAQPDVISFAGGLPNPNYFPVEEIKEATVKVLERDGINALQYSTSEGYAPLREFIAYRYKHKKGIDVHPDEILITNGSQQSLDLTGKVFLNTGDLVLLEKPSYLGAIQAFAAYEPQFINVNLIQDGVELAHLEKLINQYEIKLFYTVPNFQNPTGITYSAEKRKEVGKILSNTDTWLVEDDPYGEIRFIGSDLPSIRKFLPDRTILSGSFSKIISPGLRMGWISAPRMVIEKLQVLKQATDLHSNFFAQRIIYQYLQDNDLDQHITSIKNAYREQRNLMVEMIEQYFPPEVKITKPEGGMFLWVSLPEGYDTIKLFQKSIQEKVAFVPGRPFYTKNEGENTFRLNFSNCEAFHIEKGIKKLGMILKQYLM